MDQIELLEDGSTRVRLRRAIADAKGKTPITELVIAEPRMKHLRQVDTVKGDYARTLLLLEQLTGVRRETLDELTAIDVATCSEVLLVAMGKGLPTGSTGLETSGSSSAGVPTPSKS
jgi:hypothetical protein